VPYARRFFLSQGLLAYPRGDGWGQPIEDPPGSGLWYTQTPFGRIATGPPGSTSGGFSGWMSQAMPHVMTPEVAAAVIGGVATVMTGGIAGALIPAIAGAGGVGALAAPIVADAINKIPDTVSSTITGGQGGGATPTPLEGLHTEVITQSQPASVPPGIFVGTGYHTPRLRRVRRFRRRRY
jgi:hypothetical protein